MAELDLSQFDGHTPGDWRLHDDSRLIVVNGQRQIGRAATDDWLTSDEEIANARLISAAPQLLAELKEARARVEELEAERDEVSPLLVELVELRAKYQALLKRTFDVATKEDSNA